MPRISKGKVLEANEVAVLGNELHAYLRSPCFPSLQDLFVVCFFSYLIIPLSTVKGYCYKTKRSLNGLVLEQGLFTFFVTGC